MKLLKVFVLFIRVYISKYRVLRFPRLVDKRFVFLLAVCTSASRNRRKP
jgi:hypothetical protein